MIREYKCIECGATFTLDTKMRCQAEYCPECRRLRTNKRNAEWRQRERDKVFAKRKLERLNNQEV